MALKLMDAMTSDDKETKIWKARFSAAKAAYEDADFKTCESLLFRLLEQAKALKENVFATNTAKIGLGAVYLASGKSGEAEKELRACVEHLSSASGPALKELYGVALRFHASALADTGDEKSALQNLQKAVEILEPLGTEASVQLAYALSDLGGLMVRQGKLNEAKDYIFNSLGLLEKNVGPENPACMKAEMLYNVCHAANKDEFLDEFEDGLMKMQYQYGHKHPDIVRSLRLYVKARTDRGETDRIAEATERFPALAKILKH
jgi:tetratricopeptide (TPR) repeat protein